MIGGKQMNTEVEKIRSEIESEIVAMEAERMLLYKNPASGLDPDKLIVNVSYPYSDVWDYDSSIVNLNLDDEMTKGVSSGKDFIVSPHLPITKELKAENGIFSPKYGQNLSDMDTLINKYRCNCGRTQYKVHLGITCPWCKSKVRPINDNFDTYGWLVIKDKDMHVIHPNLYKNIEALVGGTDILINILDKKAEVDEDGHPIPDVPDKPESAKNGNKAHNRKLKNIRRRERGANEPFYGIGMTEFYNRFDEIMQWYYEKSSGKPQKKAHYDRIYEDRDKVFTHCIPVFTTHLRPYELTDNVKFSFEGVNSNYNMMSRLTTDLNKCGDLRINRHPQYVDNLLWSLQRQWNDLYKEIDIILSGKKGNIRLLSGGRCNFSGRSVIIQNPKLRADQVILPYSFLVIVLEQQIKNILVKTYGVSYDDAHIRWSRAIDDPDKVIIQIIYGLIKSRPEGLPVIINRNPSIQRGSLLQMFCIDMSFDYTMSLPLSVLVPLAADFDGDVLNIFYIINEAFYQRCFQVLNPRNSMYIDNNDGFANRALLPFKDTLINSNTLRTLGTRFYTPEQLKAKEEFKKHNGIYLP